jgi:poly(3-hydroxybutyrate) depolymerase
MDHVLVGRISQHLSSSQDRKGRKLAIGHSMILSLTVSSEGNTVQAGDGIGKGDYWDLMNGVDLLIDRGIADPDRMGLRGWSYGGILGGWTITQTDRFKAAAIGAGVYDWASEYGPGFNHDVRLWHIGSTPWDNPEAWREQSAYTHVKNVTTPTFFIHGMNDPTDSENPVTSVSGISKRSSGCKNMSWVWIGNPGNAPKKKKKTKTKRKRIRNNH